VADDFISKQVLAEIEKAFPDTALPVITPETVKTDKLQPIHKLAILKWSAAGYTVADIQKSLLELGRVVVKQEWIKGFKIKYRERITQHT
jgi:hypothetical protein